MCKAVEDLIEEGKILELISLTKDGLLSLETAATRAGMTVEEFEKSIKLLDK